MIVLIFTDNYHFLPHFLSYIIFQNLSQIALLGMFWWVWKWNILLSYSVTQIINALTIRISKHPNREKLAYSKHLVTAAVVTRDKAKITLNTKISHHWPSKYGVELLGDVVLPVFDFCVAQPQHNVGIWLPIWISWAEVKCLLRRKIVFLRSLLEYSRAPAQDCGFPAWSWVFWKFRDFACFM